MSVDNNQLFNQIGGKEIIAYFRDNDLYRTNVNGNAITIFYPEEETKTDSTLVKERMGMNRLYSSMLRIDIDSNEVSGITYLDEPDGVFYPMDQIEKDEQFIPGFDWKDNLRPRSFEDLLGEKVMIVESEIVEGELEELEREIEVIETKEE